MFTRLPSEIIGYIIECLQFEDIRSIAGVCSAILGSLEL